jgi:hypothetical protein
MILGVNLPVEVAPMLLLPGKMDFGMGSGGVDADGAEPEEDVTRIIGSEN